MLQDITKSYAISIANNSRSKEGFLKAFALYMLSAEDRLDRGTSAATIQKFANVYTQKKYGSDGLAMVEDCITKQIFRNVGGGTKVRTLSIGFLRNISGLLDAVPTERALRVLMGVTALEGQFPKTNVFKGLRRDVSRLMKADPTIIQRANEANQGFFGRMMRGQVLGRGKASPCDQKFFAWILQHAS